MAIAPPPGEPMTPEAAKAELAQLEADVSQAATPEQIAYHEVRCREFSERVRAELPGETAVIQRADQMAAASEVVMGGIQELQRMERELSDPDPAVRAQAMAGMLTNPEIAGATQSALLYVGLTPLGAQLFPALMKARAAADPQALADLIQQDPGMVERNPTLRNQLAQMAPTQDPAMGPALEAVGKHLLAKGPSAEDVAKDPALGRLIGSLQTSKDPAVQQKLRETTHAWADQALDRALAGKSGDAGIEQALKDYEAELTKLAERTGLGGLIGEEGGKALDGRKDRVREIMNEDDNLLEKGLSHLESLASPFIEGLGKLGGIGLDTLQAGGDVVAKGREAWDQAFATLDAAFAEGVTALGDKIGDENLGPRRFDDPVGGMTGAFVSRLDNGEAVMVNLNGGISAGVVVGGSVDVSATATLGKDEDGQIVVTMKVEGEAAASVSAKTGVKSTAGSAGVDATGKAGQGEEGKATFKFDPKNPEDMQRLRDLVEPRPTDVAAAAGGATGIAASRAPAVAAASEHNLEGYETKSSVFVGGSAGGEVGSRVGKVGLGADVNVEGGLYTQQAVAFEDAPGGGRRVKETTTEFGFEASGGGGVFGGIGVKGGVASAEAGVEVGVLITTDPEGNVTDIGAKVKGKVQTEVGGGVVTDGHKTETELEVTFTPEAMAQAKDRILGNHENPKVVLEALMADPANYTIKTKIETTDSKNVSVDAGGKVAGIGVEGHVGGSVGKVTTEKVEVGA